MDLAQVLETLGIDIIVTCDEIRVPQVSSEATSDIANDGELSLCESKSSKISDCSSANEIEIKEKICCGVCGSSPKHCIDGSSFEKCVKWLQTNHPHLHFELYVGVEVDEAEEARTFESPQIVFSSPMECIKSILVTGERPKGAMSRRRVRFEFEKRVVLSVAQRGDKTVTVVNGLKLYGIDVKQASKIFKQKLACGCSTSGDDIILQGSAKEKVLNLIKKTYKGVDRIEEK